MGGNPILLELSQIDERADAIRVVDTVAADAAATVDKPDTTVAIAVTPDSPRPEGGTSFNFFMIENRKLVVSFTIIILVSVCSESTSHLTNTH